MKPPKIVSHLFLLFVIAFFSASSAFAVPVTYDFSVSFLTGSLAGQDFDGQFEVEGDDIGPGTVIFRPIGGFFGELLSFGITIDGVLIDQTDETSYPDWPVIYLEDGEFTGIELVARIDNLQYDFSLDSFNNRVAIIDLVTGELLSTGVISSVPVVPIPAGGILFFSAIGMSILFRRKSTIA